MPVRPETDDVIDFLNELLALDPAFVNQLIGFRTPCNQALADHPTVQVGGGDGDFRAGMLGVVNGFLGAIDDGPKAGWGPVTAIYDGDALVAFRRTEAEGEGQSNG